MFEGKHCRNCDTPLMGPFCHQCGQEHFDEVISTNAYLRDVAQRVYRFDGAFLRTIGKCIVSCGAVADDYLAGRRRKILDPLRYFTGTIFVQFLLVWLLGALAKQFDRPSVLLWLDNFVSFVAIRFLFIFWFGSLWYFLFPPKIRRLGEIYVFATYAFGTAGLLWLPLPLIELVLPRSIADSLSVAWIVKLGIEAGFLTYAVQTFGRLPWWATAFRCIVVFGGGIAVLIWIRQLFV